VVVLGGLVLGGLVLGWAAGCRIWSPGRHAQWIPSGSVRHHYLTAAPRMLRCRKTSCAEGLGVGCLVGSDPRGGQVGRVVRVAAMGVTERRAARLPGEA
jgi:hypothetical protein